MSLAKISRTIISCTEVSHVNSCCDWLLDLYTKKLMGPYEYNAWTNLCSMKFNQIISQKKTQPAALALVEGNSSKTFEHPAGRALFLTHTNENKV